MDIKTGEQSPQFSTLIKHHFACVGRHRVGDFPRYLEAVNRISRIVFMSQHGCCRSGIIPKLIRRNHQYQHHKSLIRAPNRPQNVTREAFDLSERLASPAIHLTKTVISKTHCANKFACILLLESGEIDLHPDRLQLVTGVADGKLIYAVDSLLFDSSNYRGLVN